ncbi:MAG: DUF721 domain-containing protein [Deltaproteobacteria bacterium]|nr:DUF721 domain-containing protein [Deltaproteobacteria bacterium]
MIKVGSLLGIVNPRISLLLRLRSRWAEIVGELLAAHTTPANITKNKLVILCDSPAWIQQVGLLEPELKQRIKEEINLDVKGIKARLMIHPKRGNERPHGYRLEIPEVSMDESLIENINDPELRRAVLEFMEATRRKNAWGD